jgi:hypothetical protein
MNSGLLIIIINNAEGYPHATDIKRSKSLIKTEIYEFPASKKSQLAFSIDPAR